MCSVGGCSPRCQRRSKSSVVPGQHVHLGWHLLLSQLRQRRQPRHVPADCTLCAHVGIDEPVVGGRSRSGAVRRRRQIHQQR